MSAVWGWQYLQVFLGVILPDGFQNLVRISTELMFVLFDSKEKKSPLKFVSLYHFQPDLALKSHCPFSLLWRL
jgi:hypothetical protein